MRIAAFILPLCFLAAQNSRAQERDFSGEWTLNAAQSTIRNLPALPDPSLNVQQTATTLTAGKAVYPLTGKSQKSQMSDASWNIAAIWEGSALLANIIVSGPQSYSMDERWVRSRDGHRLTITRTVIRPGGESESVLVYQDSEPPAQSQLVPEPQPDHTSASTAPELPADYKIVAGTRILLRLTNSVNTKHTSVGDKVYLQTAAPLFIDRRLVVPVGSYVNGTVVESSRAGHIKGKSALNLRFESLILPNGTKRDFISRAGSVDSQGNLDRTEGRIQGESNKGSNAKTIGQTTSAGAGIGSLGGAIAGHTGAGLGIGAAAGAVAGLAGVLASRGPDVILAAGTTMELVLDRDMVFTAEELGRVQ